MRAKQFVEAVENLRGAQILCFIHRSGEVLPEIAQHLFPVDLIVGDEIELFFETGGEIEFDIAREEAFEKGDDEPPLVFRHKTFLVEAHIIAIAQHGERRRVGRGPADAQLLHAFDERRFGEARRRLGEMLRGVDLIPRQGFALIHRRQTAAVLIILIVTAFLINFQEARKAHDLTGGA